MNELSNLSKNLIPSEIIKLSDQINQLKLEGKTVHNFTIGDFNPKIFPIPTELKQYIIDAYEDNQTNYPAANGIAELRKQVSQHIKNNQQLEYSDNEFLISGGGRPLIYATFRAICNQGEKVLYAAPSWNNNHYSTFIEAEQICIETKPEHNFMPILEDIEPHIDSINLIALCSPQNPTGTIFSLDQLTKICRLILDENNKRKLINKKPVYILYDQIYWSLVFGENEHISPVQIFPELKDYTIYIDGISKAYAATGVRVGWAFGPQYIINKMKAILSHIGAWAPMAEQIATAKFLSNTSAVQKYSTEFGKSIYLRLTEIYRHINQMQLEGLPIQIIEPKAGLYLSISFDWIGKKYQNKKQFNTTDDISNFLLDNLSLALVPFSAFGSNTCKTWYRLSVGTTELDQIPVWITKLKEALKEIN